MKQDEKRTFPIEDLTQSFSKSLVLFQELKKQLDEVLLKTIPEIREIHHSTSVLFEDFQNNAKRILQQIETREAEFDAKYKSAIESLAMREQELEKKYASQAKPVPVTRELQPPIKSNVFKPDAAILARIARSAASQQQGMAQQKTAQSPTKSNVFRPNTETLRRIALGQQDKNQRPQHVQSTSNNRDEQIKPVDWAKEHGVKSELVMKLLRDAGVRVLTQVSKVNASNYDKILKAVEEEKIKAENRKKNSLPR